MLRNSTEEKPQAAKSSEVLNELPLTRLCPLERKFELPILEMANL